MSTNPRLGIGFDLVRIFKHIARMLGAKNVNEFVQKAGNANIQMAQTDQIMNEAQKGNIVPVNGSGTQGKMGAGINLGEGGGGAESE
jgi:hypothetical protein